MAMIVKFSKFERIAGIFVLAALVSGVVFMASVAVRQGWFDAKITFETKFQNADGVHPGTAVQIAGIKAGSVDSVELLPSNEIQVKFYILEKFRNRVKEDSVSQLLRPFVIGERVLDITVGSEESKILPTDAMMASKETMDLMTLVSGRNLGSYMETLSSMLSNLKFLAEAFLDKNRTEALVAAFDRIDPLLKNLNIMSLEVIKLSRQVTKDENIGVMVGQLALTTAELNKVLPALSEKAPAMAKDIESLVHNMATLTSQFQVIIPALQEVAPDLPSASRRALEALDEAVVLMKAMQKSFFVKSNADEVRGEEQEEIKTGKRKPSSKH